MNSAIVSASAKQALKVAGILALIAAGGAAITLGTWLYAWDHLPH